MKAYSYRRYSSKAQEQGMSLERQISLAEDYANRHELQLDDNSFEDLGVSAYHQMNSEEDAGLGQFIKGITEGKITTPCYLLVESLDRLSRANIKTAMRQLWQITDYDVEVVTLLDGKRYTKDMEFQDFLLAGLIMQRAHEESDTKSKRVTAYWDKRRANLEMPRTGRCPFWLELNKDRVSYTVLDKAESVQKMFELRGEGIGTSEIARYLNSNEYPTPVGKPWTPASVSKVLRSITAIGKYQPHKVTNRKKEPIGQPVDYYPPVVSEELYYKVQGLIQTNPTDRRKGSTQTHRNVLIDNAKCYCGSSMIYNTKGNTDYLICREKLQGNCQAKYFNMSAVESFLRNRLISPMYHNSWVKTEDLTPAIAKLQIEIKQDEDAMSGLLSISSNLSNPMILNKIQELSEAITERSKAIEELKSKPSNDKKQSMLETIELIDLAFAKEDEHKNIAARIKLKKLLPFELTLRKASGNELYISDHAYEYKAESLNKKAEWVIIGTVNQGEIVPITPMPPLTPEEKAEIIQRHKL